MRRRNFLRNERNRCLETLFVERWKKNWAKEGEKGINERKKERKKGELTRFLVDDGSDPGDSSGQCDEQQYTPHVLSIVPLPQSGESAVLSLADAVNSSIQRRRFFSPRHFHLAPGWPSARPTDRGGSTRRAVTHRPRTTEIRAELTPHNTPRTGLRPCLPQPTNFSSREMFTVLVSVNPLLVFPPPCFFSLVER